MEIKANLIRATLAKEDNGDIVTDDMTGTFPTETSALIWALNAVGVFHPVATVVRTYVYPRGRAIRRIEYTFIDAEGLHRGFMFLAE